MSITGALVLVVMSMVIPIPAALLDVGIALSIATATLILVMASVVTRPTDFQAFPVMLLISLLIRLSLNVSSTRLILTEGHTGPDAAGEVISGFSEFVAGGSLMVGITVFAVISILLFAIGSAWWPWLWWVAVGASVYGVIYFVVHDGLVHQRWPFRYVPKRGYFRRLYQAHRLHHAVEGRDGCVSFGFLYAPPIARLKARRRDIRWLKYF